MKVTLYGIVTVADGAEYYKSSLDVPDALLPSFTDAVISGVLGGGQKFEIATGSGLDIPATKLCYLKVGAELAVGFGGFSKQVLEAHGFEGKGAWYGPTLSEV